jgi:hypothetical protein
MLAVVVAILVQSSTLVLDARPNPTCRRQAGDDLVVCAPGDVLTPILDARIDGMSAKVLVAPGAAHDLTCNPAFIRRAQIMARGVAPLADVGPVAVTGGYGQVGMTLVGRSGRYPVRWGPLETVSGADCVIGPRRLPFDRVRFVFGDRRAGASTVALPFLRRELGHIYADVPMGRERLAIRFEQQYARSVLTAPAAQAIAPIHGGTSTGPLLAEPISYGVARPVRTFALHRPLRIGSLTLAAPYVRVQDYGRAMNIRSVDPDALEEGDLLVAAKRPKPGALKLVRVGNDDLSRCVELTIDKKKREISLTC